MAPASTSRTTPTWSAVTAAVLLVVAAAALGGGTTARASLVAVVVLGLFLHTPRSEPEPLWSVFAISLGSLAVVGLLHVVATSRAVATLYDAHMTPSWVLPSGSTRLGIAWVAALLWCGALALGAVGRSRVGAVVLAVAASLPLLAGTAFPTDAYRLLWDSSTFGSWPYSAGAAALAVVITGERFVARRHSATRSEDSPLPHGTELRSASS